MMQVKLIFKIYTQTPMQLYPPFNHANAPQNTYDTVICVSGYFDVIFCKLASNDNPYLQAPLCQTCYKPVSANFFFAGSLATPFFPFFCLPSKKKNNRELVVPIS